MPRKRHKPEEVVAKLRQVDVLVSQGQSVADAVRSIGVTEVTYYRWRQEFGGLKTDQVRRLKELETENARLRRAVADLTLDKLILKEAADSHLVLAEAESPPLLAAVRQRYTSDREYRADLAKYGIQEIDLIRHLQAGARSMAFSDLRFRPVTRISDEELRSYYDSLVAGKSSTAAPSFEASRAEIEDLLRGQRALEALDEWLKAARKDVRIRFREEVFQ